MARGSFEEICTQCKCVDYLLLISVGVDVKTAPPMSTFWVSLVTRYQVFRTASQSQVSRWEFHLLLCGADVIVVVVLCAPSIASPLGLLDFGFWERLHFMG